jgi:hypothetical protein
MALPAKCSCRVLGYCWISWRRCFSMETQPVRQGPQPTDWGCKMRYFGSTYRQGLYTAVQVAHVLLLQCCQLLATLFGQINQKQFGLAEKFYPLIKLYS